LNNYAKKMVDKVLISKIKAVTISYQILLTIFICDQFTKTTTVLNDKEKTQKHDVSKFNAVE